MEAQVEKLVHKAWDKFKATPLHQRLLIGVSGIPGSGKTTLATQVTTRLNALAASNSASTSNPTATFVPMDGYHLTRAQLSALPNAAEAHARRGAAFTFDGAAFLSLVREIRAPLTPSTPTICAPSFDHAKKDPVDDDIEVAPTARIVVFEGNYLALDEEPWREAGAMMDEIWFVEVDEDVAVKRLADRHVRAGITGTLEEGLERARGSDARNGREVLEKRWRVDEVVRSVEDEAWQD